MRYNTHPTQQQKSVAEKVFQEGKSVSEAMREAGYSDAMAKNPQKLTRSKGWQDIMEQIPKIDVVDKLVKNALQNKSISGSNQAIDLIFKLAGIYAAKKMQFIIPEDEMTDEELEARIAEAKQKIAEQELNGNQI